MCRLYGFRATEPTKVECSLVHAQNALMVQSRQDRAGESHIHGWGVAAYEDHAPIRDRQAWAAYHGEHFRQAAARIYAATVLAHVRKATVGPTTIENTHPFVDGHWSFIHNGTIPGFGDMRARMLAAMTDKQQDAIHGDTDSEHVFRLILSAWAAAPAKPLFDVVRETIGQVLAWCEEFRPGAPIGLNIMLTDGAELIGTRLGRTLFIARREGIHDCEICGFPHVHHQPDKDYRAIIVASEPITHESWNEIPERSIYRIGPELDWHIERL
ncbi:MAG: class II glutamine amidotransferase [Alphaproteobacteria bacterium]|nr:class II glutamine amidotransferase [Alphaproteobacteria bacterium]